MVCMDPENPRVFPTVPSTDTADYHEQLQQQHAEARRIYDK